MRGTLAYPVLLVSRPPRLVERHQRASDYDVLGERVTVEHDVVLPVERLDLIQPAFVAWRDPFANLYFGQPSHGSYLDTKIMNSNNAKFTAAPPTMIPHAHWKRSTRRQ